MNVGKCEHRRNQLLAGYRLYALVNRLKTEDIFLLVHKWPGHNQVVRLTEPISHNDFSVFE